MARPKMSIDEKIRRQQEEVYKLKQRYEAELEELHVLMEQKKKEEAQAIYEAYQKSDKCFEEVMRFIAK